MLSRDQQREAMRRRIIKAAIAAFSERGFDGASTRDIAARAKANQGLVTYYFRSKAGLWRAAADQLFRDMRAQIRQRMDNLGAVEPKEKAREMVRQFVRFSARNPELVRIMMSEGKVKSPRLDWLVETHLKPMYEIFGQIGPAAAEGEELKPHAFYVLAGAGSLIFAVAPECRQLTGLDPSREEAVDRHADYVAKLLVP